MRYCIICLLFSVLMLSCTQNQQSNTKEEQPPTLDENYQAALKQQLEGVNAMESNAEQARAEAKEAEKASKKDEVLQWLQGTWSWSGRIHVYGSQYTHVSCKLVIDGDYATLYGNDGISSQGRIRDIDFDEGIFHFGDYSTCQFDYNNRILYYDRDNGLRFKKTSQPSSSHSSYGGSNSSSSNNSSNSRLMRKFNSLNEEGRRLTDEVGSYYRTGQASPYTIQAVYRLKQIQDEKIDLARQMGDRDLENLCRQQKAQTLTALRQMGF